MTPRWALGLCASLLSLPHVARADEAVAACLPPFLDDALRPALELELERPVLPCDADAAVRVTVEGDGPVTPVLVRVSEGDRSSSTRTTHPPDVLGARAIAVIARSLLEELRAPPRAPTASTERAPPTPPPAEPPTGSPPPAPLVLFGEASLSAALMIGWPDIAATDDLRMFALTLGFALRLHHESGHGVALTARLFPSEIVSVLQVDARYSLRVGHAPDVGRVGVAALFELGLAVVRGWYTREDAPDDALERVGLGPNLAVAGYVLFGPVALGLEVGYAATINPWGADDIVGTTGRAGAVTFGGDLEVVLRAGSAFSFSP